MITSHDRILTTHVGSLPRNERLSQLLVDREEGKPVDKDELGREMDAAVRQIVEKQANAGVDVGNDGEQQRVGFQTCSTADVGLRGRIKAAARPGLRGISGARRGADAPISQPEPHAKCSGGTSGASLSRCLRD